MKRHVRLVCIVMVFTLLFCCNFSYAASDNDARFDTYINMGENAVKNNYAIPNLFRQNGVYNYVNKYPLVVKNGVEYVPLSMFILFSHIDVTYSRNSEDFFLVNERDDSYISFNVAEGVASTHDGDLLKMSPQIFNQTRYVPARTVALVLGLSYESYDDPEKGIFAFRIYEQSSKTTLKELITPYIPVPPKPEVDPELPEPEIKPEPSKPEVKPEPPKKEENPVDGENPIPPKPVDPIELIAERRVGLCYTDFSYEKMQDIVSAIDGYGIKACFAVDHDGILSKPALVRRLYVSGHTIAVTAKAEGGSAAEYAENLVKGFEKANEALKIVMKRKTRMCLLPENLPDGYRDSKEFSDIISKAGYLVITPNTETGDGENYSGSAYAVSGKIKNKITGGFDKDVKADVTAVLYCSDKTVYSVADVAGLVNKYENFSFFAMDELFVYNSKGEA